MIKIIVLALLIVLSLQSGDFDAYCSKFNKVYTNAD